MASIIKGIEEVVEKDLEEVIKPRLNEYAIPIVGAINYAHRVRGVFPDVDFFAEPFEREFDKVIGMPLIGLVGAIGLAYGIGSYLGKCFV